jgi:hypothetical protein
VEQHRFFVNKIWAAADTLQKKQKSFGSFLQKRTAFLTLCFISRFWETN